MSKRTTPFPLPNGIDIGDDVWWYDSFDMLHNGTVTGGMEEYLIIKEKRKNGALGSSIGWPPEACFRTKEECVEHHQEQIYQKSLELKDQIADVTGLVKFMWQQMMSVEFIDEPACLAVRAKAKELLKLEL